VIIELLHKQNQIQQIEIQINNFKVIKIQKRIFPDLWIQMNKENINQKFSYFNSTTNYMLQTNKEITSTFKLFKRSSQAIKSVEV